MKRIIYHYLGSSYARHIHAYLIEKLPQYCWRTLENGQVLPTVGTLLISPTPDNCALNIVMKLSSGVKSFLLLDLNHQFFGDTVLLLQSKKISAIFSPFNLKDYRSRPIPSLSVELARAHITESAKNNFDYFYVSQPLREDKRPGADQFQMLRELLEIAHRQQRLVYYKRHPRETESLPQDIGIHQNFRPWEKTIEDAYGEFKNWCGFSGLPLLCARELGRQTYFYNEDGWGILA